MQENINVISLIIFLVISQWELVLNWITRVTHVINQVQCMFLQKTRVNVLFILINSISTEVANWKEDLHGPYSKRSFVPMSKQIIWRTCEMHGFYILLDAQWYFCKGTKSAHSFFIKVINQGCTFKEWSCRRWPRTVRPIYGGGIFDINGQEPLIKCGICS